MLPPVVSIPDLPPQYRQVEYWRITASRKRILQANLLALGLLPLWWLIAVGLMIALGYSNDSLIITIPRVLLASVITVLLHEGVHALAVRAFGGKPQFGVLWKALAFYTTVKGMAFKRWVFLVFLLAPLVVLSILFPLMAVFLRGEFWLSVAFLAFMINGASSAGDVFITAVLLRYPPTAYVADEIDGVRIFLPIG